MWSVPREARHDRSVHVPVRMEKRVKPRPWRHSTEEELDARESLEDRQSMKAVAVGIVTLLFLLAVAGWL